MVILPNGDYFLVLEGNRAGEYDATLSYAGRASAALFGNRPANFSAQIAPNAQRKAIVAQWDAVEDATGYLLRVRIGGRTHLVDTQGITSARVFVDASTIEAQVSALGWRTVSGLVEYTLDSNVVPVSWAGGASITQEIPTPASNSGSDMVRNYAGSVLSAIGMEQYTTTDEDGNEAEVDPIADRAPMIAMMLCGFGAIIVFAALYFVTMGNIMLATVGGVAVWSGLGPIFVELHPAVAYGPVALIVVGGVMTAAKKLG